MRLFTSASSAAGALLALASLSTVCAAPNPNFELSKTSVDIDRHREKLDNGEIIVRVQRTDDLFADPVGGYNAKLLLEKNTHVALRIHLDADAGKIFINDYSLDLINHIQEGETSSGSTISGVKVDTYKLPADPSSPVSTPDEMKVLMNQLSAGIAKVEVKLVSEYAMSPNAMPMALLRKGQDSRKAELQVETISFRRLALMIRITEIEGKEVPHTHSILTPILQLVATTTSVELGGPEKPVAHKVHKIKTLTIDGKAPTEVDIMEQQVGPVSLESMGTLPLVEGVASHENHRPHSDHRQHPHPHQEGTGFFGWLSQVFGLRSSDRGRGGRRGGCRKGSKGGAFGRLATHRPMSENPFSGMMEEYEESEVPAPRKQHSQESVHDFVKSEGLAGMGGAPIHRRPPHHPHPHFHHRQGRKSCSGFGRFVRDMAFGFVTGMALVASLLVHPITLMFAACFCLLLIVGKLLVEKVEVRFGRSANTALTAQEEDKEALLLDEDEKVTLKEVLVAEEKDGIA